MPREPLPLLLSWRLHGSGLRMSHLSHLLVSVGVFHGAQVMSGLFVRGPELVFLTHLLIGTTNTCQSRVKCCGQYKGAFDTAWHPVHSGNRAMCPDPWKVMQSVVVGSLVARVPQ